MLKRSPRIAWSLFLVGAALASGCGSELSQAIRSKGYKEIVPPTVLVPPGTIVKIVRQKPLILERVCSQKAALGDIQVDDSSSANEALVRRLSASIKLTGDYLKQLRLSTQIDAIRNVQLDLTNVRILDISRDAIRDNIGKRSQACKAEIEGALLAKERLIMIQSVIQADVSYMVDFKRGFSLDAGAEGALLRGFGVGAGAQISHDGTTRVTGTSLFWGIRELTNGKSGGIDLMNSELLKVLATPIKEEKVECRDPEGAEHREALEP
ncbi:MAG TPA: hypothetical protein VH877_24110 [Polyangia bacterium]|jgi:hypothetical protein|nr:hypothetical protein [Polyangia bacterium]